MVGSYVCVGKAGKVWVAHIDSFDEEFKDFFVCFLHPPKMQKMYWFPLDKCEQGFEAFEKFWVFSSKTD